MEWELNPNQQPPESSTQNNPPQPASPPPLFQKTEPAPESEPKSEPAAAMPQLKKEVPSGKLPSFSYFFNKTFAVYRSNFWAFLLIAAIPVIFSSLVAVIFSVNIKLHLSLGMMAIMFLVYLAMAIVSIGSFASLLFAIKERDSQTNIGEILKKGFSIIGSYLWISLICFIIIVAGFILFIIPGIIFSFWYCLSVYVLIYENKKGMAALRRSKELISGYIGAYFGRTVLFGLIVSLILLIISLILKIIPFISLFSEAVLNALAAPLTIIFTALVFEEITKLKTAGSTKSPREIIYSLLICLLFILLIIGILATIVMINLKTTQDHAQNTFKNLSIKSSMNFIFSSAEMYYMQNNSYLGLDCSSEIIDNVCDDIKNQAGKNPTIYSDNNHYCAFVELNNGKKYYCVNGSGVSKEVLTFPGGAGYCDGLTFECP
jgi:hypothetical protein